MTGPERSGRELGILALTAALIALASPLRQVWMRDSSPWWLPFAIWLGVLGLGAIVSRREGA